MELLRRQALLALEVRTAQLESIRGEKRVLRGDGCSVTVFRDSCLEPSLQYGNPWVRPLPSGQVLSGLRPYRGRLQTVSILCQDRAEEELREGPDGRLSPLLRWTRKVSVVLSALVLLYYVWYTATQGGGIPSLVRSVGQTAVLLLVWWGMGRAEDWLRRHGRSQAANWAGYGFVVVLAFFILQLRSTLF